MAFVLLTTLALNAKADENLVDTKLAQNAIAVARVKLIFAFDGKGQFTDYAVHTIRIFKNESNKTFRDIDVLAFKGRPGVPGEECTVYLQRYDVVSNNFSTNFNMGRWILMGGDASNGVSNVTSSLK